MSCIFIAAPIVIATGGWPVFAAAAVAAGASIGFRKMSKACQAEDKPETEVELLMENSRIVSETMDEDQTITLERGGIQVELRKDERGRFGVCVRGKGVDRKTLEETGAEVIGRVRQQYAYMRIMSELESRGYSATAEECGEDRRIKIKLERMA